MGSTSRRSLSTIAAIPRSPGVSNQPAKVISWTSSRRVLRVSAAQRCFLVVNQNFIRGWTASYGHRVLSPVRLDGWQQAWLLPAGTSGIVTLTYTPDARYRENVLAGLIAIALVIGIALIPGRRRRRHSQDAQVQSAPVPASLAPQRPLPRLAARWTAPLLLAGAAATAAAGLWLGGYPGSVILPVATAGFVIGGAMRRRSPLCRLVASPWLVVGLLLAAGLAGAIGIHLRDGGHAGQIAVLLWNTGPQVLCLIAIARLAAALVPVADENGVPALAPAQEPAADSAGG
jgi:arabinofuranan 3-O-arabinosyltransferase